jgi:MGT family glycosyltransferase
MKIGFVSLAVTGHLNPMTALARKLKSRGHKVVFIGIPDAEPAVRAAKLDFVPFCEKEYPEGKFNKRMSEVARLHGLDVVRYTARELMPGLLESALEHLPQKIAETGVEAFVFDSVHFLIELVPMRLGMPYIHIWNVLNMDMSGATPPIFFSWPPYEKTQEAVIPARKAEAGKFVAELFGPLVEIASAYAKKHGMQIDFSNPMATTSKLAVISQTPKEFDFPTSSWPTQFHYAGPFHDGEGREQTPFPWEKLTGKPLVYASMGTLVNGLENVYRTILKAVEALAGIQLVISVGHNVDLKQLEPIPSNAIVVRKAPQIELLKRAVLCITHAGLNTALESLAQGVPMVAIPMGYDQPGVAARIAHHGVGEFIEFDELTAERLSEIIQRVRGNPSYREKARAFQNIIAKRRGLEVAANAIEDALKVDRQEELAAGANYRGGHVI